MFVLQVEQAESKLEPLQRLITAVEEDNKETEEDEMVKAQIQAATQTLITQVGLRKESKNHELEWTLLNSSFEGRIPQSIFPEPPDKRPGEGDDSEHQERSQQPIRETARKVQGAALRGRELPVQSNLHERALQTR